MKVSKIFRIVAKYIELKMRVIRLNRKLKKACSKFRCRCIEGRVIGVSPTYALTKGDKQFIKKTMEGSVFAGNVIQRVYELTGKNKEQTEEILSTAAKLNISPEMVINQINNQKWQSVL